MVGSSNELTILLFLGSLCFFQFLSELNLAGIEGRGAIWGDICEGGRSLQGYRCAEGSEERQRAQQFGAVSSAEHIAGSNERGEVLVKDDDRNGNQKAEVYGSSLEAWVLDNGVKVTSRAKCACETPSSSGGG